MTWLSCELVHILINADQCWSVDRHVFGLQVPVRDDRFLAVNTLRLIGSLLNSTGSPCRALWDPEDPLKWMYGRYDKTMCVA